MNINHRTIIGLAALFGAASVIIGAFGAHLLRHLLEGNGMSDVYETAVHYLFFHTLALFMTGLVRRVYPSKKIPWAAACFAAGMVLFSGSLLVLSITNMPALGIITPFGGILLIAGWLLLFLGTFRKQS